MKFIFSFVCFFLPLIPITEANSQQISFYTSRMQNYAWNQEQIMQAQYQTMQKAERKIEKDRKKIQREYEREKQYFALQMQRIQKQEYQESMRIEQYNQLYKKQKQMEIRTKQMHFIMEKHQKEWQHIQDVQKQLEQLQKQLFEKETSFQEFKKDGNPQNQIKGSHNLPIYGSMKASNHAVAFSCLVNENYSISQASEEWMVPIQDAYISAGTWQYPQGGLHLGIDFATSLFHEVQAPANGIILYADAPVESNEGYLKNWSGWPQGAGNSICMVCAIQEDLYVVSFAHLSDQIFVHAGQEVHQGDVLALSGNSGNSSGPHTHVEVLHSQVSLQELVDYFIDTADFSFENGWDTPHTCSQYACRIRPESVF